MPFIESFFFFLYIDLACRSLAQVSGGERELRTMFLKPLISPIPVRSLTISKSLILFTRVLINRLAVTVNVKSLDATVSATVPRDVGTLSCYYRAAIYGLPRFDQ